jgi:outer membrane protein
MIQILIFLWLFFSPSLSAWAEEMTLDQCLAMAHQNSQVMKAQEMEVLSSEEVTKISRSDFYPALKLQGRDILLDREPKFTFKSNSLSPGIPPRDVDVEAGDRNFYSVNAMVEQTLFKGGQLKHSLRKSESLKEEASHSLARQRWLLTLEVKRDFRNAFREQYRRRILEKEVEFKKERLKILRERLEEGYASREDVMIMETDLATSEEDLFKVKSREELAQSRLKRLIYYPADGEILLKGETIKGVLNVPLAQVKEAALKNRDELKMALARVSAAEEDIGVAKGNYYPKATLQGGYAYQKETAMTRPDVWFLNLQADWSVFEWGKTRAEVRKAEAVKEKRRYEHEDLKRAVQLEAEESWRAVKEQEREISLREKRLQTAEYRLKRAMERYKARLLRFVDVLELETELKRAHQEYLLSLNDLSIALAHLEASASEMPPGWFTPEPPYRPNLESLSQTLNSLLAIKEEKETGTIVVL